MIIEMTIPLDERVSKFVQAQAIAEHKPAQEIVRTIVEAAFERELYKLYQQYERGDMTLRGMARELGINYRDLYQLLDEKKLPF